MVTIARAQQRSSSFLMRMRQRLMIPRTDDLMGFLFFPLPEPAGGNRMVVTSIVKVSPGEKDWPELSCLANCCKYAVKRAKKDVPGISYRRARMQLASELLTNPRLEFKLA